MAATSDFSPVSFQSRTTDGWFYTCVGAFVFSFCIAAFGPSIVYTGRATRAHHSVGGSARYCLLAWLLLFIAQTILARTNNLALHRRMGMWAAILAAALVVLAYETTIEMGRRGYDLSGDVGARSDPLAAIAFLLLDTVMLVVLFLAAYR